MASHRWWRRSPRLLGVLVVATALTGCSSSDPASTAPAVPAGRTTVDVTLKDFGVAAAFASVPAGDVTFSVQNSGAIPHEFVLVKSDLASDKLPLSDQKLVDEKQVQVVSKLQPIDAGTRKELTVAVQPGKYVLLCNVASHYVSGMFAAFEVTSGGEPVKAGPAAGGSPAGGAQTDGPGY